MTPERVAEIYAEETGFDINDEPAALQDFARRMWNEALEEAANLLDAEDFAGAAVLGLRVRALKLPEE